MLLWSIICYLGAPWFYEMTMVVSSSLGSFTFLTKEISLRLINLCFVPQTLEPMWVPIYPLLVIPECLHKCWCGDVQRLLTNGYISPSPTTSFYNFSLINMISSFTSGSLGSFDPWVVPHPKEVESYGASMSTHSS
jgi:hypothetical protein